MNFYYHLRYNIYPAPGFPVEKEEWMAVTRKYNEQQLKQLLVARYETNVTLILLASVCREEYDFNSSRTLTMASNRLQLSIDNVNDWRQAGPSNMLKKLNEDSELADDRYRNIDEPAPLL